MAMSPATVLSFLLYSSMIVLVKSFESLFVVEQSTVTVKNMLLSKCFAYPVQITAFPDTGASDGLSASFENCDGELPPGSEVTDIPYGIMQKGQVLSMPAQCSPKKGKDDLRTGAFRVTLTNLDGDSEDIIAIVNPNSELLKPLGPPTYTINSDENVDLEVDYPTPAQISWAWDGRVIQKWKGQLKIKVDQPGIYQAFNRAERDCRITYRVIKRACPAGMYGPPACTDTCTCPSRTCDDQDGTCICPPGLMGTDCATPSDGYGFGVNGDILCEENGLSNPGCAGVLFCRPDPYGCSCMFNHGGVDCTRKCQLSSQYGFACENDLLD